MPRAIGGSRTRCAMQSPRARAATQRNGAADPPGRPSPAAALGVRTATASCQSSAAACFSRMMPRSVSRCWPPARRRPRSSAQRPVRTPANPARVSAPGRWHPSSGRRSPRPPSPRRSHYRPGRRRSAALIRRPPSADRPGSQGYERAGCRCPRQHRQRITAAGQRRRTHARRADRRRQSPGRPLEPAPPWFGRSPGLAASSPASGFGGISASENLFHYCVKQLAFDISGAVRSATGLRAATRSRSR
jgi:hypothetical protein